MLALASKHAAAQDALSGKIDLKAPKPRFFVDDDNGMLVDVTEDLCGGGVAFTQGSKT